MNFFEYLIITADDIDEWCLDRGHNNESPQLAYARRKKFRVNMIFPGMSYSYYMWYMGTWLASYMVLWKVPCSLLKRCNAELIACITQSRYALPEFGNGKILQSLERNIDM